MTKTDCQEIDAQEPIHNYFGLTYSNYLVLHRTIMQNMPVEWQTQFVRLLHEMEERCQGLETPSNFIVKAAKEHEIGELNDLQLKEAGITEETPELDEEGDWADLDSEYKYWDNEGRERHGWERILLPVNDPIPHYRDRNFTLPKRILK